ncbi:hypothetical protein SRIMM317S_06800 [Streptomyces rimosus subsp. rimosus]
MTTDIHQHLWPPRFLALLRARTAPPLLDGRTLHLPGEPPHAIDPADHDPAARTERARADGLDRALISLSSPLGIEFLPPAEAAPLLDAFHDEALTLPAPSGSGPPRACPSPSPIPHPSYACCAAAAPASSSPPRP